MTFRHAFSPLFYRLTELLKHFITPKSYDIYNGKIVHQDHDNHQIRKNFPCDSHPHLCLNCFRLRYWLHTGHWPDSLTINTNKGVFSWIRLLWKIGQQTVHYGSLYFHHKTYSHKTMQPHVFECTVPYPGERLNIQARVTIQFEPIAPCPLHSSPLRVTIPPLEVL